MQRRELRIAIAGTGLAAAIHARAARLAGARLVGVSGPTLATAAEAARALGAERAFASCDELVADPGVDVVHVCAPDPVVVEAALAAGKHVICEQPVASDLAGARRLADAAAEARRVAAVALPYRYHPAVRAAAEAVREGRIGAIRVLHGTYLDAPSPAADDDAPGAGCRAFADLGSHWCDLAEHTSGHRIVRLSARALPEQALTAARADADDGGDAALVQFETDRGALGSVVVSRIAPGRDHRLRLELEGADGTLAFDEQPLEEPWAGPRQGYADCFDAFVADAYDAIAAGTTPDGLPLLEEGVRAAAITQAVRASAREQRWVAVPRFAGPVAAAGAGPRATAVPAAPAFPRRNGLAAFATGR